MNGSTMSFTDFKRITDKYGYRVQIKGSSYELLVKTIIFTSNYHPREWYNL